MRCIFFILMMQCSRSFPAMVARCSDRLSRNVLLDASIVCGSCHYRGMDGVPRSVGDDSDGDEGDDDGEVDDDDGGASGDAAASKKTKKGKKSKTKRCVAWPLSWPAVLWLVGLMLCCRSRGYAHPSSRARCCLSSQWQPGASVGAGHCLV